VLRSPRGVPVGQQVTRYDEATAEVAEAA
jgi:hypothetical protein